MTTPRKPGGYADRQELNRAMRANKRARTVMQHVLDALDGRSGLTWLYPSLAELAQCLSTTLEALTEMGRIRSEDEIETCDVKRET